MLLLLLFVACDQSAVTVGEDTATVDIGIDPFGDEDTAPARPCAFIDNWLPTMQLPAMTLYRYDLTGCGVVNGCTCADSSIADAAITAVGFLDGSQGPVELVINAWVAGTTTCTCAVVDYDYADQGYSAAYSVAVESTE